MFRKFRNVVVPGVGMSGVSAAPDNLSGVVFWRRAGPSWCFTDAGTSSPAGNGDLVQNWTSRKDAVDSFTVSQATAGDRPTLRLMVSNSVADVRGVTADFMSLVGSGFNNLSGFTLFVAGIADSLPANLKTLIGIGDPVDQSLGFIRSDGANWQYAGIRIGGLEVNISTTTAIPVGSRFVIGVRLDPTLSSQRQKLYSGTTVIGSANLAGDLPATMAANMRLLTDSFDAARGWPGGIYEVVGFNRAITDVELAEVANYLA